MNSVISLRTFGLDVIEDVGQVVRVLPLQPFEKSVVELGDCAGRSVHDVPQATLGLDNIELHGRHLRSRDNYEE